jgi:leucyl aminopeptidase
MRAEATTNAPSETGADTVAIGIFEGEAIAHDVADGVLQALVDSGEARPGLRKLAVTHAEGRRYVLAGLGARDAFDAERARVAAASVVSRARELGTRKLCWELPHRVEDDVAAGFVEGTLLAAYAYRAHKTAKPEEQRLEQLALSAHHDVSEAVDRARTVAAAANAARDLQNSPANELTPTRLAARRSRRRGWAPSPPSRAARTRSRG